MATTVVKMKTVSCGDHGGTFDIPVRRGRNPRACTPDNPCTGQPKPGRERAAARTVSRENTASAARKGRPTPRPGGEAAKRMNTPKVPPRREYDASGYLIRETSAAVVIGEDNVSEIASRSKNRRVAEMTTELPEKELPLYSVYYPMAGDIFAIIHAPGCDHIKGAKLERTTGIPLDLHADDYTENVAKIDVDALGYDMDSIVVTNCAKNYAKRTRREIQKAAEKPSEVVVKTNPALPLAQQAKEKLVPLGWTVQGRGWVDTEQHARITATRGTELLVITWTVYADGEITCDQTYDLWNTEKPVENAKPKAALTFNPALVDDDELARMLMGQRVKWFNAIGKSNETATVSTGKLKIEKHYNESGHSVPSERIITFVDHTGTGYRSFRLSALLKVG